MRSVAPVFAGASPVLEPGAVTSEAVAGAVARLLAEPSCTAAAGRLRHEVAGMPSPDALEWDEPGRVPVAGPR